uniref:Uncharacterized protein n=1 Tax=Liagora brachyclada TaxID=1884665 RepID=A0A1G4P065_9FLOR|nr:Hypothetical protein ORF_11 [Liagora brachyclada]SCW24284.1 Hypothetical protein ORF_11 [Liagora brachyclada]
MYFNDFLCYLPKHISATNHCSILISVDFNNLYYESCLELSDQYLCFLLLTTNTVDQYYSCFLMMSSYCLWLNDHLALQLIGSNTRALSLYLWLDLNVISVVQTSISTTPYIKLKSMKSKTKNILRRYLIS